MATADGRWWIRRSIRAGGKEVGGGILLYYEVHFVVFHYVNDTHHTAEQEPKQEQWQLSLAWQWILKSDFNITTIFMGLWWKFNQW